MMLVEYDASARQIQKGYSAWESLLAELTGASTVPSDRYRYHRDALVELCYFEHRMFRFKHIESSTPASKRLWEIATADEDLANLHTTGTTSAEPFVIEVWDTPDQIPGWEGFVRKYDVPDFEERYLTP